MQKVSASAYGSSPTAAAKLVNEGGSDWLQQWHEESLDMAIRHRLVTTATICVALLTCCIFPGHQASCADTCGAAQVHARLYTGKYQALVLTSDAD